MRPRVSLLAFSLMILILGGLIGLFGRAYFRSYTMHREGVSPEGILYKYSLIYEGGFEECQFVVFYAPGAVRNEFSTGESGHEPKDSGISWHPEGLYLDGRPIETGGSKRVFVLVPGRIETIELPPDEIEMIRSMEFERFLRTDTYKRKVFPLVRPGATRRAG